MSRSSKRIKDTVINGSDNEKDVGIVPTRKQKSKTDEKLPIKTVKQKKVEKPNPKQDKVKLSAKWKINFNDDVEKDNNNSNVQKRKVHSELIKEKSGQIDEQQNVMSKNLQKQPVMVSVNENENDYLRVQWTKEFMDKVKISNERVRACTAERCVGEKTKKVQNVTKALKILMLFCRELKVIKLKNAWNRMMGFH